MKNPKFQIILNNRHGNRDLTSLSLVCLGYDTEKDIIKGSAANKNLDFFSLVVDHIETHSINFKIQGKVV